MKNRHWRRASITLLLIAAVSSTLIGIAVINPHSPYMVAWSGIQLIWLGAVYCATKMKRER